MKITDTIRKDFHAIYSDLFKHRGRFPLASQYRGLEAFIAGDKRFVEWPIVGITAAAWDTVRANVESGAPRGLGISRAHRVDRIDRAREMFERDKPLPWKQAYDFYAERDRTILATRSENQLNVFSRLYDLPIELFGHRTGMGAAISKARYNAIASVVAAAS